MPTYTVKEATPTGKSDPTFGIEHIVYFNEDPREVKLSRKNPIQIGQQENGQIIDGKYGAYFKKDKKEWNPTQNAESRGAASAGTPTAPSAEKYVPYKKTDNSDGQRQGMCINNAANYVNSLPEAKNLKSEEWAHLVHGFASALYALGDLDAEVSLKTVKDVFNAA